ncbi:LysE family transporter [candidate division KSB1 bacterium]|nr:LysE family transporter [candidate division KSB1 bacterium]
MIIIFGLLIGFFSAMPLGPVNLIAISQVMKRGFLHGFLIGVTSGIMDAIYCYAALIGIAQITSYMAPFENLIKIIAILVFILLGVRSLRSAKNYRPKPPPASFGSVHKPIIAALALCLTNPALYAYWIGVAGYTSSQGWPSSRTWAPGIFAVSVFFGAVGWYTLLSRYVAKYHHHFSQRAFRIIFTVIAVTLFVFAGYTIFVLIQNYIS